MPTSQESQTVNLFARSRSDASAWSLSGTMYMKALLQWSNGMLPTSFDECIFGGVIDGDPAANVSVGVVIVPAMPEIVPLPQ